MKFLFKICLLGLLAGCASTEKVELGNQGYPDAPVSIYLVPMEGISSGYAASVAKEIESRHKLRTKATTTLGRDPSMFDPERRQYIAGEIARQADRVIKGLQKPNEQPFILVLTPYDLNAPELGLRFVFSAHMKGISVISTARIDPVTYDLPRDDELRNERLMKLVNKAIGQQVHRYPVSSDRRSVMYGPIMSLGDLDSIGAWY